MITPLVAVGKAAAAASSLAAMSPESVDKVRRLETEILALPQTDPETEHLFHAGLYARTVHIPAGAVMTGALIKIATVLIVSGRVTVFTEGEPLQIDGYRVLAGAAGRKQAFMAHDDTWLTMLFATDVSDVAEAEAQFTDEAGLLLSRKTGDQSCQA